MVEFCFDAKPEHWMSLRIYTIILKLSTIHCLAPGKKKSILGRLQQVVLSYDGPPDDLDGIFWNCCYNPINSSDDQACYLLGLNLWCPVFAFLPLFPLNFDQHCSIKEIKCILYLLLIHLALGASLELQVLVFTCLCALPCLLSTLRHKMFLSGLV